MSESEKKPSISNNYIMNMLVNVFTLLIPLITTPYISRTLGSESIGIYSYCLSIETYFVVLGTMGIPTYAKREVASVREHKEKLNQTFSEVLTMQVGMLLASIVLYLAITVGINTRYRQMFAMCGIGILATVFDVSWLFLGLENFKIIVTKSVAFKAICVALIFLFVKDKGDLYIYALSLMLANLLCNIWLFVSARQYVQYYFPSLKSIGKHLKPAFFLLLPSMVTTVYAVIDKTMLGMISGEMSEVGYYEQSQKIVTLSLTLITSMGAVLMPRLAALFGEGNKSEFHRYINNGVSAICFVSLPLAVGCFVVSNNLVPWFYGTGFDKIKELLKIFAPMLVFMGMSDLIGAQLFVSIRKEKQLLIINILTTAINLTLNAILIPHYLSHGAAFATMISEFVKCTIFIVLGRKYLKKEKLLFAIARYGFVAATMGFIIWLLQVKVFTTPSFINTMILIAIGGMIYIAMLFVLRDEWVQRCFGIIKSMVKRASR